MRRVSAGARYIVPLFFLRSRSRSLIPSATKKSPVLKAFLPCRAALCRVILLIGLSRLSFFMACADRVPVSDHGILFTGGKISSTSFLPAPAPPASRRVVAHRGFQLTHSRLRRQFEWRPLASAAIGQERLVSQHRVVSQLGTRLRFRYGHRQCGNADSHRWAQGRN